MHQALTVVHQVKVDIYSTSLCISVILLVSIWANLSLELLALLSIVVNPNLDLFSLQHGLHLQASKHQPRVPDVIQLRGMPVEALAASSAHPERSPKLRIDSIWLMTMPHWHQVVQVPAWHKS